MPGGTRYRIRRSLSDKTDWLITDSHEKIRCFAYQNPDMVQSQTIAHCQIKETAERICMILNQFEKIKKISKSCAAYRHAQADFMEFCATFIL